VPLDFWLAMAAQLAVVIGAAIRLEHRITTLETHVEWLMGRRRADREDPHEQSRRR